MTHEATTLEDAQDVLLWRGTDGEQKPRVDRLRAHAVCCATLGI